MFPATTKGGGMCMAFPNVCKVPSAPSPIPIPFPSMAQCTDADGDTCSSKVKIKNKVVLHKSSKIKKSSGDQAGSLKGLISSTTSDAVKYKSSSSKVKVQGKEIVAQLKSTGQNGSNANAPAGVQVTASQTKVLVG